MMGDEFFDARPARRGSPEPAPRKPDGPLTPDQFIAAVGQNLAGWIGEMNGKGFNFGLTIEPAVGNDYKGRIWNGSPEKSRFHFTIRGDRRHEPAEIWMWSDDRDDKAKQLFIGDRLFEKSSNSYDFILKDPSDIRTWEIKSSPPAGIRFRDFMDIWIEAAKTGQNTQDPKNTFKGLTIKPGEAPLALMPPAEPAASAQMPSTALAIMPDKTPILAEKDKLKAEIARLDKIDNVSDRILNLSPFVGGLVGAASLFTYPHALPFILGASLVPFLGSAVTSISALNKSERLRNILAAQETTPTPLLPAPSPSATPARITQAAKPVFDKLTADPNLQEGEIVYFADPDNASVKFALKVTEINLYRETIDAAPKQRIFARVYAPAPDGEFSKSKQVPEIECFKCERPAPSDMDRLLSQATRQQMQGPTSTP